MPPRIKLAELARMAPKRRAAEIARIVEATRQPNGILRAEIENRIRAFELRYEVTSQDLVTELREGRRKETAEIAEWLFLLDTLDHCVAG